MEVRKPKLESFYPCGPQNLYYAGLAVSKCVLRSIDANLGREAGRWVREVCEVGGGAAPQTKARPSTALQLQRASASSCVEVGSNGSALFQSVRSLHPTHTPSGSDPKEPSILLVLHNTPNRSPNCHPDRAAHPQAPPGQRAASSPSGPALGARPRPVLTPAAAAVTADCSAARAERSRLRPICSKLRNSLDRSRELVAEAAEWLCSSRLLRRTTIFPCSGPPRPRRETGPVPRCKRSGSSTLRILAPQAPRQRTQRARPESLRCKSRPRRQPTTAGSKLASCLWSEGARAEGEENPHPQCRGPERSEAGER